jgi:hypothetical protein
MRLAVRKGLIQEGECINVDAGSASPLIPGFPNSFTNNRLRTITQSKSENQKWAKKSYLPSLGQGPRSQMQHVCTLHQMSVVLIVVLLMFEFLSVSYDTNIMASIHNDVLEIDKNLIQILV